MLKFSFLILLISTATCEFSDFHLPNYSSAMSRAVVDYIINFYDKTSSAVNMYHNTQPENLNVNMDIMNEILHHVKTKIVVQVDSLMDFRLSNRKRINNIFFVDSFESFKIIYEEMNSSHFEYQGYYLIAVTEHGRDIYKTMADIFSDLWIKKIINVNILFMPHGNNNEAMLYTYYPYTRYYCENTAPIQLNQYQGKNWMREVDYFPRKLTNFHGCHLSVATFKNPPFMIIKQDKNGVITVNGIEGILLRELAYRLNFNVDLYVLKKLFGEIFKNGSATGAIKMIVNYEVNLTLGFFASMPLRDAFMQPSYVYFTTNLLWMVPPGKPQSALEKLANPLKYMVWTLSSMTILIGFIVIVVVKKQPHAVQKFVFGNKSQTPSINFMNLILGNSIHQVPTRNFSRYLLMLATLCFFIIRTCYSSGLVKFMQMDTREKHMMSTSQMIEENFTFYLKEASRFYVLSMPEVLKRTKLLKSQEYESKLHAMMKNPYSNAAFLTTTGHLAYRNQKVFPKFYEFAPTPLYSINIVMYMNLGSCLEAYFGEMLMKLISSGLINKWATEFIDEKYLKKPIDDVLESLSLEQLEGAFQLLIGGLLTAFIAFCFENLIGRIDIRTVKKLFGFDRKLFRNPKTLEALKV
ncbi:unnamed protein product [Chironomus riparius]|uniref:Putative ionotropic receptor ligand binding domain-containing protein n=1 Tax=Chironomus riparius TaxID=315576 RepID=A0A9N9RGG9_9DIPT|nr:unnamed protein product [Chironomus riparius]